MIVLIPIAGIAPDHLGGHGGGKGLLLEFQQCGQPLRRHRGFPQLSVLFLEQVQLSFQLLIFFFDPLEGHVASPGAGDPIMDPGNDLKRPADHPSEGTAQVLKHTLELPR